MVESSVRNAQQNKTIIYSCISFNEIHKFGLAQLQSINSENIEKSSSVVETGSWILRGKKNITTRIAGTSQYT